MSMTLIVQEQLFGTGELVSSAEEGFLHSLEAIEMKGVTTPLSSTSIMPSPIFLWRFKVSLNLTKLSYFLHMW